MTRKKKVAPEGDALLLALEDALKAMNLKSEPESSVISEPKPKPKPKPKKKTAKKPIFTPSESPEPEVKRSQDVAAAFSGYFGAVSKLDNWRRLCWDLGIEDEDLSSLTKCKKALQNVNVNILDVVEAQFEREVAKAKAKVKFETGGAKINLEDEGEDEVHGLNVKKFRTQAQLIRYTRRHKKYYPKEAAKEMGPIRCLLKSMK